MIHSILAHRATIERASEQMVHGSPLRSWSVVTVRTPVLLSRDGSAHDPTWTATQRREANSLATLFSLPTSTIQPGDRVTLTRPPTGQTFEVLPDPAAVLTLHTVSHHEHKVREVTS